MCISGKPDEKAFKYDLTDFVDLGTETLKFDARPKAV